MLPTREGGWSLGTVIFGIMGGAYGLMSCKGNNAAKAAKTVATETSKAWFKQSLAQWSVHKELFDGSMDNLDFAKFSSDLGFEGIEYVSQFFKDQVGDKDYLNKMNTRAKDSNVEQLLIMIDGEGDLASESKTERKKAIENHKKWVDAAAALGCHSLDRWSRWII